MALARMVRFRRAVLAAAFFPSSRPVVWSSILRPVAASASSDTGALFLATHARTPATSPGGSERCFGVEAPSYERLANAGIVGPSADLCQHDGRRGGQRPGDVLAVLGGGLLPLHVHVQAGELVPSGVGLRSFPRRWPAGGKAEDLTFPGSGQQRAAEAVGLRSGAEALPPELVAHLPPDVVGRCLLALVDLGPVDPSVIGRPLAHQAAFSREASQRWYSDRRMRRLPFGSVTHLGALPFARHS